MIITARQEVIATITVLLLTVYQQDLTAHQVTVLQAEAVVVVQEAAVAAVQEVHADNQE